MINFTWLDDKVTGSSGSRLPCPSSLHARCRYSPTSASSSHFHRVFRTDLPILTPMAPFRRLCVFLLLATVFFPASFALLGAQKEAPELHDHEELELVDEAGNIDGSVDAEAYNYDSMSSGFGEAVDEKDVVVLGARNFTEFVKGHQYVLVEFYAPWCGHCQSLAPEYAKAATALKGEIPLAKVDATQHGELAQHYGVEGYPTLFFFIDGENKNYNGQRTSEDIVTWIKKKTGPAVDVIKSTSDAEELLDVGTPIAVAYLESVEGMDAEEYIAAARQEDGVLFYMTADAEIAKKFGLDKKTPSLVLLKKQNEKVANFDGTFERKGLSDFVAENKLPLVITFSRETASTIFESDVSRQLLLFAQPEEFKKIASNFEEAAKSFKRKLIYVLVDLSNQEAATPVLEFFSLTADKTRLMAFVAEEIGSKFLYDGDFSVDSIKSFSEKFLAGDLTPYLKSESRPETNDEDVKVVVGETFDEIVLDDSKDVLLEVYAPWCGHCQALEPEYDLLGKTMKNISSIVIAKMDGTKNEHARVKIEGFPAILFFPAGKKSEEPLAVDTERTAGGFITFFKSNAAIPFESPEIPEPLKSAEYEEEPGEDGGEDDDSQFGAAEESTEKEKLEEEELKDEL